MSTIIVNGNSYSGKSVLIVNGKVIVNGEEITTEGKEINISIEGNIDELKVDACDKISIVGSAKTVSTKSGNIKVNGNVDGNIQTMSGNVNCGVVNGSITTMSGNINQAYDKKDESNRKLI